MKTPALKSSLHELIDRIENRSTLTLVHDLLQNMDKSGKVSVFQSLSAAQKREVMESYEESENEANLVAVAEVLKRKR